MELDQEMKNEFINEVKGIQTQLLHIVQELQKNRNQPKLFEKFGQVIDRIYGTAATLGFQEFGNYSKAMKDMTYMCAQTESPEGQSKVLDMMERCLENFNNLILGIENPLILKQAYVGMKMAINRVSTLERSYFQSVKNKKSC